MKEAELCERFREAAREDGWEVYPEVIGWDLVLVWTGDRPPPPGAASVEPGDRVAIEAKARASIEALDQAVHRDARERFSSRRSLGHPDFRAVLVPSASRSFDNVARALGLRVYTLRHCGPWTMARRRMTRRDVERPRHTVTAPLHRWRRPQQRRLWLPPVVSEGAAGEASPAALTPWRVKALRLCARLRRRGYVTSVDFEELELDRRVWHLRQWIERDGSEGRRARYRVHPRPREPLPDHGFEKERDALESVRPPA